MNKHDEQLTDADLRAFNEAAKGYWFDDESEVITAKGFWRRAKLFYRDNPRMLSAENSPEGVITSISAEVEKLSKFLGLDLDEKTRSALVMLWPLILDEKTRAAESKADSSMETLFRLANFLQIDFDKARSSEGKPSDVYIEHIHQFADRKVAEMLSHNGEPASVEKLNRAEELGKAAYEQVKAYRARQASPWTKLKRIFGA